MPDTSFQDDVIDRLARIETNQTNELAHRKDHNHRIRALERWKWYLAGAIAVGSAGGPFLLKAIFHA